jgi:hypothetical protein
MRLAALLILAAPIAAMGGAPIADSMGLGEVRAERVPAGDGGVAADTIVWRNLLAPRPLDPEGWNDPRGLRLPRLQLGLKPVPLPVDVSLQPMLTQGRASPRPGESLVEWGRARLARQGREGSLVASAMRVRLEQMRSASVAAAPAPGRTPSDTATAPAEGAQLVRAFLGGAAELGVRVAGRAELGGDWSRSRPCLSALQDACSPRVLPQLSPDMTFAVQLGGLVRDRLSVDVDFDQIDAFEAANRINIVYDGGEDAVVRRLELGDVNVQLPRSRFLTEGIATGNFGFQATGQMGPLDFRAIWAEQRGQTQSRVFRLSGVGPGRGFVQADTLILDDADYAKGQFFFLVDPGEIPDYPHVDVLSLDGSEVSPAVAPGPEPIQLYRYANEPITRQQVEGFIQADAVAEKDGQRIVESGWFRYLQPGVDYFVHPSGLWIALRAPLARDEMLAVTYLTATGEAVGDYNPERLYASLRRPELRLLKASAANHQPGRPTWEMEMHQVYRVSGSRDVERASVAVTISLGELSAGRTFKRAATGEEFTFLRLFGLDQEAPQDAVDPAFVYEPARDLFEDDFRAPESFLLDQPVVQGTFLVFPTLRPFAEPPPLPAFGLSEQDTRTLLGPDANHRIYEDPDPFERDNGGRFRLTIPFQVRSDSLITSFSLGALGISEGSERIYFGERLLVRGEDYDIDYDLGQVLLRSPEVLFAADPDAPVRARWEQRQLFQAVPTSVMGLAAHTRLGVGEVDFLGLYQSERTLAVRPLLGLEPASLGLGGVTARLSSEISWLDRLVSAIPGLRPSGRSMVSLDGEVVLSLPTPNTRGDVFLDDFDAAADRLLSLMAPDWTRGSAPALVDGAEGVLPAVLDESTIARATWQHTWILEAAGGDSVGIKEGFFPRQEVDRQIRFAGSEVREPGMLVTFGGPRVSTVDPSWTSITTTLSPSGVDLTKSEYLEFYAAQGVDLTLVVDLGEVSEDAFFVDDRGLTSGTKENGVPWGLGLIDHEADPSRAEIWGEAADRRGVWGESCLAERGRVYRPGDRSANCTRGNGRRESEDLNVNGLLDAREKHLRWVVRLDGSSQYLVRARGETGTAFQLYRLPLQGITGTQVGGAFTDADMRGVKNIRITVVGARPQSLTLARMRIVGSRWIRRNQEGVLHGIAGDTLAALGRVEATPASRVTEGDAYQSPPGVLEGLADPSAAFGGQGIEFSEKSLAIRYEDLQPGDRAEVYDRFPQRPRSFLMYRQARFWVVARSGRWADDVPHYFFFKVGNDPENFYLFRKRLNAPGDVAVVRPEDWLPEMTVHFGEWLELRRRAELILNATPRSLGDPPLTLWSADSTYAVVLTDRGGGPDLANVREMAFGVWNQGNEPITGEVWVDELRLGGGVTDAGSAANIELGLAAADFMEARVNVSDRGAFFRQLNESATYQNDRLVSLASTFRLDRFAPAEWGLEVPLSIAMDRVGQDPVFLANSDVRADRLPGLRASGARQTRVALGVSKRTPSANPLASALLDGLELNLGWFDSNADAVTAQVESQGVDLHLRYSRRLDVRSFSLVPSALEPAVRFLLPSFLSDPLLQARLRWSPDRFALGTTYLRHQNEILRFDQIIEQGQDSLLAPTQAPREAMETSGQLTLRPFTQLTADVSLLTVRDLLRPEDAVSSRWIQELIRAERASLVGVDWGWETRRILRTSVGWRPRLFSWLRHDLDWSTSFATDRNTSYIGRIEVAPSDTAAVLLRNANGDRNARVLLSLDPRGLSAQLFDPAGTSTSAWRPLANGLSLLRPVTATWQHVVASRFNRAPVDPGYGYQLGLGDAEDFRFVDRDTASVLTDRTVRRVQAGAALPQGLGVDVAWTTLEATVLDTRSDRIVRDERWPDVQARLDSVPMPWPASLVLRRVSLAAGYVANLRVVELGGRGQQRRTVRERDLPVDVALTWLPGTITRYRASFRSGDGRDPTGGTQRDRETHTLTISSALRPPFGIARQLTRPLQLTVILSQLWDQECRATVTRLECVPFIDQVDRSIGVTLGAVLQGLEVGLQSSYTDRQSNVGQQTGSTRFQLGLYGQFLFEAGVLPGRLIR